jgi:predicted Zn-dependent peptidase
MEKVELDFEGAKQNLFRVLNDQSDTLFQMATFNNAASNRSLTDNLNWRKEIAKQVMGLTIEDVQSVAKEIFENNPEHLKFLMSGESPKGLCQKVLEGN